MSKKLSADRWHTGDYAMGHTPPPLFRQGPSALVRLVIFVTMAAGLFFSDARYRTLEVLREAVGTGLYPLQWAAILPRDVIAYIQGFFITHADLQSKNEQLNADNLKLALQALNAAQLTVENNHLRALLHLASRAEFDAVAAEIRYDAQDAFSHKVIIDRGAEQGIRVSAPVINQKGVLGQVTRVYPLHSEVTLITDENLAVPVQLIRTGMRSLVYGLSRGDLLSMRFIPIHADVQPGDELITSGLDELFPPGLPVARVIRVNRPVGAEFARIVCEPIAPVHGERQLLALHYKAPTSTPAAPSRELTAHP